MGKILAARLARLVATLFAVSLLTFLLVEQLPGDPVTALLPPEALHDLETMERIRTELRLDDPALVRYGRWVTDALQGDLGKSYITDQRVADAIRDRIPVTMELALLATVIAAVLAIPIGAFSAYREGGRFDRVMSGFTTASLSIPAFVAAIFFIWLFTLKFNWLPSTGWNRITDKGLLANLKTAILPASALALAPLAINARLIRADMIGTLKEDYILSARAKGLRSRYILMRHALRPSSLTAITIFGLQFGALIGGTVVIETIFALPGLGTRLISGIYQRDVTMIQGITLFVATVYVVVNLLVDLLYLLLDPRIRRQ
ncbi:MAG: ABC transporter permease [Acidimicrobiales bacterium]|nr:ABC transporter permease [Acidimicrobiales bacterium]HIL06612.1 ABC transporter permease [Acidimicrobiia bacterium]